MKKTIKDFLLRKGFLKKGVKVLKNKKGLSLIEIMVVLGLLVIIGGIATTQYADYTTRAKKGAINATMNAITKAVGVCLAAGDTPTICLDDDVKGSISANDGLQISHTNDDDNTCYYIVPDASFVTGDTDKIKKDAVYGVVKFVTATGKRLANATTEDADNSREADTAAAIRTISTGCK